MQMHASPPHDISSAAQQQEHHNPQLLYSPIRQSSPSPDDRQPLDPADDSARAPSSDHQPQQRSHLPGPAVRQHHPQHHLLCSLPREVQMRVLYFLSADSLTSVSQACSQFSSLCSEPVLWRRLYVHRWGKNVRHNNTQSWKVSPTAVAAAGVVRSEGVA